jgi:hypothetical protein
MSILRTFARVALVLVVIGVVVCGAMILVGEARIESILGLVKVYGNAYALPFIIDIDRRLEFQLPGETDCSLQWSKTGKRLFYQIFSRLGLDRSVTINAFSLTEGEQILTPEDVGGTGPLLSPDGTTIAFQRGSGNLHLMRLDGSDVLPLLKLPYPVFDLLWSPDSRRLLYRTAHLTQTGVEVAIDGMPQRQPGAPVNRAWT